MHIIPTNMTDETSLNISTQETPLLQNNPPHSQPPKMKNLKAKIFFLVRILTVLILAILILYYIYSKNRKKPEPPTPYASGLSDYYCHLTPHPKLCNDSMSSVTNATTLQPDPALLFATSLQLLITHLNHTNASIARARGASNASLAGPGLSTCQALIGGSFSLLNASFGSIWLEPLAITDEVESVIKNSSGDCLLALSGIDGVEEVRMGVEEGRKLLANYISLFQRRQLVYDDFYSSFIYLDDEGYNYIYSYFFSLSRYHLYGLDYGFLVCLYSVMYLFIVLLYFLFWQ